MLIVIPHVLDADTLAVFRQRLSGTSWVDGRETAGNLSAQVKQNRQLSAQDPVGIELGNQIVRLLSAHPLFLSAALPNLIHPPLFNRYSDGGHYGMHVDGSIMPLPDGRLLRSDLSATLFLSEPDDYDGGELTIETAFGAQAVKLEAGDMVLYPSSSLHQVTPVTSGERLCSFFWIQSMVADAHKRSMLFDLDQSIQSLRSHATPVHSDAIGQLTGVYHNLLRQWAQV
jgi:PKHD-type hydroxylase